MVLIQIFCKNFRSDARKLKNNKARKLFMLANYDEIFCTISEPTQFSVAYENNLNRNLPESFHNFQYV